MLSTSGARDGRTEGRQDVDTQIELQVGADRVAIQDLMARYAYAVDAKRWDLLEEVFEVGGEVDFVANGGIKDTYPAIGEWLKTAMSGFTACQHYLSNFATDVTGDCASSRFYVLTQMITTEGGADQIISDGGYYRADFVRTPQGWRVRKLSGGIVWWSGSVPSHLPWWGTEGDRFTQ
jgi:hypothetical protein